jgi:hypothetical protein
MTFYRDRQAEELAESSGLRETFAGGDRDVPLQDPDRSHAARSHAHEAENGSATGLFRDQSDDGTGKADLAARSIKVPASAPACS